jgi:DNA polymerase (family 10)
VEVDILPDGSLDLKDNILKECDVVLASVHSRFNMEEGEMTRRIIKAIVNPYVNILAHPTGRLILERLRQRDEWFCLGPGRRLQ